MKKTLWIAGAMMALLSGMASAANRPVGYVTLCTEGKTCAVASATNVAFGRADKFFYKVLTGSFVCNEATFGGKVAGGVNECSVPGSPTSSSSSKASSVSSSSSSKSSSSSSKTLSSTSSTPATPNSCQAGSVITNSTVDCGNAVVGTPVPVVAKAASQSSR